MESVSVVISTYNGANKIRTILESLTLQSVRNFNVIIVNDGSTDSTIEVVQSLIRKLPLKIELINQVNKGRSAVRNTGARAAENGLLIFFDDDMRLTPNCVEKHIKYQEELEGTIVVGSVPEDLAVASTDIQKYKAFRSRIWHVNYLNKQGPLSKENLFLTAANFSIPKKMFFLLEGFDENLNDNEDFDLAIRAYYANFPVYFRPDVIAWHDDFITFKSFIHRQREYRKAQTRYAAIKPDFVREFNRYQIAPPSLLKRGVYNLFAKKEWVDIVDKELLNHLFPQKVRYKLYTLISTSLSVYYPDVKI
ncbi:glycosyltransferase family 2 protein [Rufibacter sp. LB8]|uniref:glycosyltransferase family 2 protein n=1 Tax=Rufibacter sp. LB8 TaxID=2777781 RepID=UPI00178C24F8|nr:glycosyltransferase family 2 protein [Rufibacter sp. LB8]